MTIAILEAVRTGVYATVKADTAIMGKLQGVFVGQAPNNQAMPYITLDNDIYACWDTFQNPGWDGTLQMDLWNDLYGGDGYMAITADCYRLFHHPTVPIVLTQYKCIDSYIDWMTVTDDQTNNVRRVLMRLRLYTQSH